MATVKVLDIIPLVRDYARSQNLDVARAIRAIDSAIDIVRAEIGIPGHEKEHEFDFFDSQQQYSAPADFMEPISLRFKNDRLNNNQQFTWKPGELLFKRFKSVGVVTRLWGTYAAAGLWQIIVLAKNSVADILIDTFDQNNSTNWTASNDATNIADDKVVFEEGVASLKFDVDVSLSGLNRATIKRIFTNAIDLSSLEEKSSAKCFFSLPETANFTSVSLNWGSSDTDYWKVTVTTQEDGSALAKGNFKNKLKFDWSGATKVGSPDSTKVDRFWFDFDYTASYANQSNFRVDNLRFEAPDAMIMTYYTSNKAKDSSGAEIEVLSAQTDEFLFGAYDPSIKQLIALQAAIIINPQLLVDDTSVKALYKNFLARFKNAYPKKRANNLLFEPKTARTTQR